MLFSNETTNADGTIATTFSSGRLVAGLMYGFAGAVVGIGMYRS